MELQEEQNRLIAHATRKLEEQLEKDAIDFGSMAVTQPTTHLRHNLIRLGLHSVAEDSGSKEERIRLIAKKGRDYLNGLNVK